MAFLLHHLLSESAAKYPDKEAIVFREVAVSYAELEKESNKLAHGLISAGVKRGERVGIYLNRSATAIVGLLGILKTGAAYVPIDPVCPPGRLSYILHKCGIKCLLTDREKLVNMERLSQEAQTLESVFVMDGPVPDSLSGTAGVIDWHRERESAKEAPPCVETIDSDLAYILFTSGSTGNPKGVMLTHRNSLSFVNAAHDLLGIRADDRFSNICPLHFDMSVFDIFIALRAGATIVIIPETAAVFPVKLTEAVVKNRISVWNSVPSVLSLLASYGKLSGHDLSSMRLVCFAGEVFPLKYLQRLREALPSAKFCNMYGQTEANSSTCYRVEQLPADCRSLPIGKALPNFELFALDENGMQVTGPGREGELYVRSATVASGYWGEAEKTERAFVKNPLRPELDEKVYRTGDLVRIDSDGNYHFLGRKDNLIKSRGYRIEIGEIEAVMCSHPGVSSAVVLAIPDELIGNRIVAVIVPSIQGSVKKEDIIDYCSKRLPKYMIPELIEFSTSLPATSSGKIDRKRLSDHYKTTIIFSNRQESCIAK